ncbi:glycine zipper domain-containing protein [uncultured Caulobacter sp.]|uniref:glycine zipper 2TM domain-containing protein n=1 Tax=uncultured Caulobacter sp. TaxID=158749 RepID=UPI00260B9713|nr:glycine zipper domain-containing protein [uncultured Caulobacter sp.]
MTCKTLAAMLAATVACGAIAPAFAQDSAYQRNLSAYDQQRSNYYDRVAEYQDRQDAYERDRANYLRARDEYDRRYGRGAYDRRYPSYADRYRVAQYRDSNAYYGEQADFERARASYERARYDYDRRYGEGAYDRRHPGEADRFRVSGVSQASGYDTRYDTGRAQWERDRDRYFAARDDYDRRYGAGAYDRRNPGESARYATPYAGGAYSIDTNANVGVDTCRQDAKRNATVGGVIGALAGAALGSNVAARNARPEGTVLGALVGAGVGAAVGNASAKCDTRGAYYTYDQTQPYRYSDGRYASAGERCRLAPAPTEYNGRVEQRYVRVCPDADGRYRVES